MRDALPPRHPDETGFDVAMCCECCRADTAYGDHEPWCPCEPMDLAHVEVLADYAAQAEYLDSVIPLISHEEEALARLEVSHVRPIMRAGTYNMLCTSQAFSPAAGGAR